MVFFIVQKIEETKEDTKKSIYKSPLIIELTIGSHNISTSLQTTFSSLRMTNDLFRSFNFSLLFLCVCFLLPQIWGKNQWGNRIEMILFILQAQVLKMKKMGSEWLYDNYCLFLFYILSKMLHMCFIASYVQWFSCYNRSGLLFLVCEHRRCSRM